MKIFKYLALFLLSAFLYACSSESVVQPGPEVNTGNNNKVLVEMFTNYRCPYCPPGNAYLDSIHNSLGRTSNDTNVIILRYHTTLYPNDPFYDYNIPDNNARQSYYTAHNANPRGFLMGGAMGVFGSNEWSSQINNKLANTVKLKISLSNSYNTSMRTGSININILSDSGLAAADLKLHIALTESEIMYAAPNGETIFNNTMRDLISMPSGNSITLTAGNTFTADYPYTVDESIEDENCEIVVFVQSESTKEVFGVQKVKFF